MSECGRVARQLRASYEGPAWHGPSLKELLNGMTAETASDHPLPDAHSIWELVNHLTAWARVARLTITGSPYVTLSGADDWPPASGTWDDALVALDQEHRELIAVIREMPDERLSEQVSEQKGYSMYVLLHGVVQHNLYHAGQIALLRKTRGKSTANTAVSQS